MKSSSTPPAVVTMAETCLCCTNHRSVSRKPEEMRFDVYPRKIVVPCPVSSSRHSRYGPRVSRLVDFEVSRSIYHSVDDLCCLSDRRCLEAHVTHAFYHLSHSDVAASEFVEVESSHRNGSFGYRIGGLEDGILSSTWRGHGCEDGLEEISMCERRMRNQNCCASRRRQPSVSWRDFWSRRFSRTLEFLRLTNARQLTLNTSGSARILHKTS